MIGEDGLEAFLPLGIDYHRAVQHKGYEGFWYWSYSKDFPKIGMECCSRYWISSHCPVLLQSLPMPAHYP